MGKSIEEIIKTFPTKRQKHIRVQADKYIQEYKTLQEVRKLMGITQNDLAKRQGVNQVNISNLENRSDMLVSTLKGYVEAMGCELEIHVKTPDKSHILIDPLPSE
jgi:transcriptional regulator with XRE-family HTH domain